MKNLSKLLVASALVVSFAAPVFAATVEFEGQTLADRNTPAQANGWTKAYAMEAPIKTNMSAASHWDHAGKDLTVGIL